jgi:hypothetical protein
MTHSVRTLLKLGAVSAALVLSACGSSDRQTPSLDLPFTAPAGASKVLTDFIEVCSLSMIDRSAAISALDARGWQAPSAGDIQQMAAFGGYASESENGEQLQIISIDFPHVDGVTCLISSTYLDETPDFSPVGEIPGMLGEITSYGDGSDEGQLGRFSGIGPDGYPLTIQVLSNNDLFYNLSMTTTRPVKPSDSNQE